MYGGTGPELFRNDVRQDIRGSLALQAPGVESVDFGQVESG
jgi:hypothetical protein